MAIARAVPASVWLLRCSVFCCPVQWTQIKCDTSPLIANLLLFVSLSAPYPELLFIWVTCCTRFLSSTAWPSWATRGKWRASSEWRCRPYQVRLRSSASPRGMKGLGRTDCVWLLEGVKWRCFVFPSSGWGSSRLRLRGKAVGHCQNLLRGSAIWKGKRNSLYVTIHGHFLDTVAF